MKKTPEQLEDDRLVRLAQANDDDALETLIRKYLGVVKGKKHSYFIMGAEDEDVVQEGTIGLLKAIRGYDPDRNAVFSSFAELCINRQILTAVKAANRKKHVPLNSSLSLSCPATRESEQALEEIVTSTHVVDPETQVILEELFDFISRNEGKRFSAMEIKVWQLYMQGRTYPEIAGELGKPSKSIYNAMERTKKKILAYLAD